MTGWLGSAGFHLSRIFWVGPSLRNPRNCSLRATRRLVAFLLRIQAPPRSSGLTAESAIFIGNCSVYAFADCGSTRMASRPPPESARRAALFEGNVTMFDFVQYFWAYSSAWLDCRMPIFLPATSSSVLILDPLG